MGRKRGKVVIEFGSADDLDRIVSEIIGSGPGMAPDWRRRRRYRAAYGV